MMELADAKEDISLVEDAVITDDHHDEGGLTVSQLANLHQTLPPPAGLESFIDIDSHGRIYVSDLKQHDPDLRMWIEKLRALRFDVEVIYIFAQEMDERQKQKLIASNLRNSNVDSQVQQQALDLLQMAAELNASDVHITIGTKHAELEFRLDGDLQRQKPMEVDESKSLLATIMNSMVGDGSNMYNPGERQDARISNERFLPALLGSVRIASGPLADGGRYMVMRLLYKDTNKVRGSLEDRLQKLGYNKEHIRDIRLAWDKPSGINIIAGPTGSGKSTTLKHVLEALKEENPEENYLSVEDPPEYHIAGVRQIPVNNAKGSDARGEAFADVIRFTLRSDPDKILVGEIRDRESLRLAIRAAMSGHGVSASLHANSAFGILKRCYDLLRSPEIPDPATEIADESVITGLIFQRLVKNNCPKCCLPIVGFEDRLKKGVLDRLKDVIPEDEMASVRLINPDGCEHCEAGVVGRSVVAEVVVTDAELMDILKREGQSEARRYWLEVLGGKSVYQHAIQKIKAGTLAPDQAERAVGQINTEYLNAKRHERQQIEREKTRQLVERAASESAEGN